MIDRSYSMTGTALENAKNYGKSKNPSTSSVWGFNWTCDKFESVDDITCYGATRISHALKTVMKDMKIQDGYVRQTLYFITDAQDLISVDDEKEITDTWRYLIQNKNAVGEAHFFGAPGQAKDCLELS